MTEDEFWNLVDGLVPVIDANALEAALMGLSEEQILGFHEQLLVAADALDTPAHSGQEVSDYGWPGLFSDTA